MFESTISTSCLYILQQCPYFAAFSPQVYPIPYNFPISQFMKGISSTIGSLVMQRSPVEVIT